MLDIGVAYNRFKFLGFEFLTWVWFLIDTRQGPLPKTGALFIGNRIVLENRRHNSVESLTITGDDAGLEEGMLALKKGALVTEMNLTYQEAQNKKWCFSLKGENLNVQQIKLPDVGAIETQEDIDAAVFEKTHHYNKIIDLVDMLFKEFIKIRLSPSWSDDAVLRMKQWIT